MTSHQLVSATIFELWDIVGDEVTKAQSLFAELLVSPSTDFSNIDKAQVKTQIARSLGLQSQFKDAHDILDEAQEVLREEEARNRELSGTTCSASTLNIIVLNVRIKIERGRVYNSAKSNPFNAYTNFLTAIVAADDAKDIMPSPQDSFAVDAIETLSYLKLDALHMLAIVAPAYSLRVSYAEQGIAVARGADKARGRTHTWLAPLLNNLGWEMLESGRFSEAIGLLHEAAEERKKELNKVEASSFGEYKNAKLKKAFTAWKIGVWSVGHAQMKAERLEDAYLTLSNLLKQKADGPSIREDLTYLCAWKAITSEGYEVRKFEQMALEHAKRALELGVC